MTVRHESAHDDLDDGTWAALNALVDGELAAHRLPEVAAGLARDPRQVEALATLTRLKAATARAARAPHRPALAPLLLAVAAGALASGLAFHLRSPSGAQPSAASPIVTAAAQAGDLAFGDIVVPDLSAAQLRLERVDLAPAGGAALVADFRGERGCRLRLTVAPERQALPELDGLRGARWVTQGYTYALTSETMDSRRFAAVTSLARLAADRARTPTSFAALSSDDLAGRPCLG